ncbi:MAG: uroporphyrinogen-III synthase [Paracoccus denitrificans]|nr:MAG: uroporphyrinogen-III synthase [Paracoccus denitrificans]PZO85282.1 MAG: uroporphyrinogen-III synthase [Paracoccus denitrificans]
MPATAPRVLLTRPLAASTRFAADVRAMGLDCLIAPLMRIVPVAHDPAVVDAARNLIFTSENAIPFAGQGRGRSALCVGPRTALAAHVAGFAVTCGPGDAARLMPMLPANPTGWLHLRGRHVSAHLNVPEIVVYDQAQMPMSPEGRAVLAAPDPVILPLFSPRSARLAAHATVDSTAPLMLAAISAATLAAWRDAGGADGPSITAITPDADGMLTAVGSLAKLPPRQWVEHATGRA